MTTQGEPEVSDAALAARVRAGDHAAEADLFRRLGPRVRLYGLRHLHDPAAADDLVQDVILMTFDALREGRVREPNLLASFVLGTCRRVAANQRRGVARRQRLLDRFGPDLAPRPGDASGERPAIDLVHLARCLERLSERERSVVVLSFYAERDSATIGSELGLTEGNVRVVRHRALARLRGCMVSAA
ncbi:MAG TPA: sigma-70 family RNA polymerase sigma factor [Vicinamibacteria bacterium]|nr:sigma-70 family RNA polymerase sigma factor [Vicinamibacteria bacterium]